MHRKKQAYLTLLSAKACFTTALLLRQDPFCDCSAYFQYNFSPEKVPIRIPAECSCVCSANDKRIFLPEKAPIRIPAECSCVCSANLPHNKSPVESSIRSLSGYSYVCSANFPQIKSRMLCKQASSFLLLRGFLRYITYIRPCRGQQA